MPSAVAALATAPKEGKKLRKDVKDFYEDYKEDPKAKFHIALRRGPVILAQENRLGYSVDEPVDIVVEDGYVDALLPSEDTAPYEHIVDVTVPLEDGRRMTLTDYSSAGKKWNEETKMAAWILTKKSQNA